MSLDECRSAGTFPSGPSGLSIQDILSKACVQPSGFPGFLAPEEKDQHSLYFECIVVRRAGPGGFQCRGMIAQHLCCKHRCFGSALCARAVCRWRWPLPRPILASQGRGEQLQVPGVTAHGGGDSHPRGVARITPPSLCPRNISQ